MVLHLKLNPDAPEAVYEQLAQGIRQLISDGLLPAGSRLPSMRQLSRELGVSINTVYAACDLLAAQHLIETRQGSGTFITSRPDVATGADLGVVSEPEGPAGRDPVMDWSRFAFDTQHFLVPRDPAGAARINFAWASPDPALYPFDRIKQIVTSMLWSPQEMFFDRGHPQGYLPLVDHLEKQMALSGVPMAAGENEIIITGGFHRALSVVLNHVTRPGDRVAVESPGYSGCINLLRTERRTAVPIAVDSAGLDTAQLARELASGQIRAIVTTPTFHNPTGITLSAPRRQHLLELAAHFDVPIIEDDWGRELRYEGLVAPPLKALDRGGYVIHIGSYSKTFLPGLRLGWITCPSALARQLVYAKLGADQADSYFLQALLYEFISRGHYARHLRHTLAEYRKRRNALCRALASHLPAGCRFATPQGGFSVWLELPPGLRSAALLAPARQAGLEFLPAAYCMPDRHDTHALRLSFSRCSVAEIEQGIPRLCQLIADCSAVPEGPGPDISRDEVPQ